jgi:CRP-like cAMP-binding protein
MRVDPQTPHDGAAAIRRLSTLTGLDQPALAALQAAVRRRRSVGPRFELLHEGRSIRERLLILRGWAARMRVLEDGRRQIMSFLLPGDLVGNCRHPCPVAVSVVATLTDVEFCAAPDAERLPCLAEAYAISGAMEEAYLLAQITRLGRLNAEERLTDLLLELLERLERCGLASHQSFDFPLTQEVLADMTGLTPVHVNRMIQLLRRQGAITLKGGRLTIAGAEMLARRIGRSPAIVTDRPPSRPGREHAGDERREDRHADADP